MAWTFLSLKLAFIRRRALQVRHEPARVRAGLLTTALFGWLAYQYGPNVWELLTATGEMPDAESFLAMQSFSLVFMWVAMVFSFAGRRDLDVRRFQLLPLSRRELAFGLSSTWLLSPGVYLTAGVVAVMIASFPSPGTRLVLMVAGGVALVALCAMAGQLTSSGTDLLARKRRARDFLVLASVLISLVPILLALEMWQQFESQEANSTVGDVIGWLPVAWPGRTIASAAARRRATPGPPRHFWPPAWRLSRCVDGGGRRSLSGRCSPKTPRRNARPEMGTRSDLSASAYLPGGAEHLLRSSSDSCGAIPAGSRVRC